MKKKRDWIVCAGVRDRERTRDTKRERTQQQKPQCVAVCCSVLQYVAVCCSVLQCVAVCSSVLQCVAVCCSVLQFVVVCCSMKH